MYCPRCATRLARTATRCHECALDVEPIARLLAHPERPIASTASRDRAAIVVERWRRQRHGWGLLLVMTSLLVGCLIPICLGLFSSFAALNTLILVLAGLAGALLICGSIFLMYAVGQFFLG